MMAGERHDSAARIVARMPSVLYLRARMLDLHFVLYLLRGEWACNTWTVRGSMGGVGV